MATRLDVHQHVTDQIIAAIEKGAGSWEMPWHRPGTALQLPVNVESEKHYNGINILNLWIAAETRGYASHLWGTYRQWEQRGGQVRRGEKASLVVLYKDLDVEIDNAETGTTEVEKRMFARASWAFNIAQVDGIEPEPVPSQPDLTEVLSHVDRYIAHTGARIEHGGTMACYRPSTDIIQMPDRTCFIGTATSTPTEAYYHTTCHELVHWTGAQHRLDRDFGKRFERDARAVEELVAELGSAFLAADLGINAAPRQDHAQYIAHWLAVLKSDKRAIFTAAAAASKAVAFLDALQPSDGA